MTLKSLFEMYRRTKEDVFFTKVEKELREELFNLEHKKLSNLDILKAYENGKIRIIKDLLGEK